MNRYSKFLVLLALVFLPHILGGAVCARATELPIIVKAVLPAKGVSKQEFKLDISKSLAKAGITSTDGKIPAGAPASLDVTHADKFDLTQREEFKKYGAQVKSAYINYVSVEIRENTFPSALPKMELGIGRLQGANLTGNEKYNAVAEVPPLAKGVIGAPAEVQWDEKQFSVANQILSEYKIAVQLKTRIDLTPGAPMPQGVVNFFIHMEVTFVIGLI